VRQSRGRQKESKRKMFADASSSIHSQPLAAFFCLVDLSVRHINHVISAPVYGPFFKGSICATTAWGFAFPFEVAKSKIQGTQAATSTRIVMAEIVARDGIAGLYQGFR
jgi:hypothetical protein